MAHINGSLYELNHLTWGIVIGITKFSIGTTYVGAFWWYFQIAPWQETKWCVSVLQMEVKIELTIELRSIVIFFSPPFSKRNVSIVLFSVTPIYAIKTHFRCWADKLSNENFVVIFFYALYATETHFCCIVAQHRHVSIL